MKGFVVMLISLLSLAIFRCFTKTIKTLNYLCIKNSWIWFIKKLISIWVYPSIMPNVNFIAS